jgi:hypothetical protein
MCQYCHSSASRFESTQSDRNRRRENALYDKSCFRTIAERAIAVGIVAATGSDELEANLVGAGFPA